VQYLKVFKYLVEYLVFKYYLNTAKSEVFNNVFKYSGQSICPNTVYRLLVRLGRDAKYGDWRVYMSVYMSVYLSVCLSFSTLLYLKTACPNFTTFLYVLWGRSSSDDSVIRYTGASGLSKRKRMFSRVRQMAASGATLLDARLQSCWLDFVCTCRVFVENGTGCYSCRTALVQTFYTTGSDVLMSLSDKVRVILFC